MSNLGDRIRKARNEKGLSQVELASLIGVKSGQIVSNWEKGENKPNADLLVSLCKVLNLSAADLLDYHGKEPSLSASARSIAARYDQLDPISQRVVESVISIEETRVKEQ